MNNLKNSKLMLVKSIAACFLYLGISLFSNPLSAMAEDYLLVVRNNTIVFDVMAPLEEVQDVILLDAPAFGEVEINGDMTMTFKPFEGVCEETDGFSYLIDNAGNIDTVSVTIDIICEKLTFLSGFSPDGDGVNDTFRVIGAEAYPDNSLVIFNKWGEEVYSAKSYDNSWDGTDKNGEPLKSEDNVYYYVFNDGENNVYSGYLKIE